jgi:hypothetical protein
MIYYAYDTEVFSSNDIQAHCGIKAHQVVFNKGKNTFELFNRRSTPYSTSIHHPRYDSDTFTYSLEISGDISIYSKVSLPDELRLSGPILHRKFNYETRVNMIDYKIGLFTLNKFKDAIHINRVETISLINKTIVLLGGLPLVDLYRSATEKSEMSRDFYFIYRPSFPADSLKSIYQNVYFPLSLLDVNFDFYIVPQFRLVPENIKLVTSTSAQPTNPHFLSVKPLITSRDVSSYKCSSIEEVNYLLLKPTANKLNRLSVLIQELIDHNVKVVDMVSRPLTDYEFNLLYPNCLQRVYGPDWYSHMCGGNCIIVKTSHGSFEQLRCCAWSMRKISGLPWVKNVVHSACDGPERDLMLRLFEADFIKFENPIANFKIFAC